MRTSPVAAILVFAGVALGQDPAPTITWQPDLAAAKAAQAKDGKPVLAYFTFET